MGLQLGAFSFSMSKTNHIAITEIVTPQEWEGLHLLIKEDPWYDQTKGCDNPVLHILELLCRAQKKDFLKDLFLLNKENPLHDQAKVHILELLGGTQKMGKEDEVSVCDVKPIHAQCFFELFNRTRTLFGEAFEKESELLILAVQNKWVNGVRFLLQHGYNPNDERILDELLEGYDRHENDDLIFQALLEAGLDGSIRHRKGDLYSEFIAESCWSWFEKMAEFQNLDLSKHEGIVLALLTRPRLVWVAKEGEPVYFSTEQVWAKLEELIHRGADLYHINDRGFSAISMAIVCYPDLIQPLLEKKVSYEHIMHQNKTTLHKCAEVDAHQLLKFQNIQHLVNQVDTHGNTALHDLFISTMRQVAGERKKRLSMGIGWYNYGPSSRVTHWSNMDISSSVFPLYKWKDEAAYPKAIAHLVDQGLDINKKNCLGHTALMLASFIQPQFVSLLLRLGADPSVRDDQGWSCVEIASLHEKGCEVFDAVKEAGYGDLVDGVDPPYGSIHPRVKSQLERDQLKNDQDRHKLSHGAPPLSAVRRV